MQKLSTKDMSREQWLEARKKSIGGSDAACIIGLNPYRSPYALWCEKSGKITPDDISDKEAVRLGNDLEDYVARRFMEATGKKVRRENAILYNEGYPFAHANPDRMVIGENAGLECKTTSSWDIAKQLRAGEIPDHWLCQMYHYMAVTGAKKWYLGALVFGTGFFWFEVERDEASVTALMASERAFWDGVISDTPPALDGSESTTESLRTIFRDSAPGSICDLSGVGANIQMLNRLSKQIAELEAMKQEQQNIICDFMGESEKGAYDNTTITWKTSTRKTFDKKAYERDHGVIPDNYYKSNTTRSFRVSVKEK